MDYEKAYKEALKRAKGIHTFSSDIAEIKRMEQIFPELAESEDERIRKNCIHFLELQKSHHAATFEIEECLAWLEKQKDYVSPQMIADAYLRGCNDTEKKWLEKQCKQDDYDDNIITRDDEILQAISVGLTDVAKDAGWSDFGGIPIEDIMDWLEKQGQVKEYTFKSLPRLLNMIEPTSKAKAYCQKLIDTLINEGYAADAKIVCECLRKMCGEKIALATMDEEQEKTALEHPTGGELLHVLNKGHKQGYKDAIDKACEWLKYNFNMPDDFEIHFRKAMEEQQ